MEDYLPKTRKEVLHFCFRKHLGSILRLDLLSLLAFLPILFALICKESYYIGILQKLTDASTEDVLALGIQTNLIFGLLEALALLLFIIMLAGAAGDVFFWLCVRRWYQIQYRPVSAGGAVPRFACFCAELSRFHGSDPSAVLGIPAHLPPHLHMDAAPECLLRSKAVADCAQ